MLSSAGFCRLCGKGGSGKGQLSEELPPHNRASNHVNAITMEPCNHLRIIHYHIITPNLYNNT